MRELVCFSHLRWAFVFQRPQHLMTRASRDRRVWFIEEPAPGPSLALDTTVTPEGVHVCVPRVPDGMGPGEVEKAVYDLVSTLVRSEGIEAPVAWTWSPMMLPLLDAVAPRLIVYDCMDELSAFRFAAAEMLVRERQILARADLVFTGGRSLWEARRGAHPAVHLFPSCVDVRHFAAARRALPEPPELAALPRPRIVYMGVVDERMDLALLEQAARARPEWSWILLGPVVKIDAADIPRLPNVHVLGPRDYTVLPTYLAHVDVGMMPFARNDATRFISPTKTPEYLAAGLPVVSTPVRDVVRDYGARGLVHIADGSEEFVAATEASLPTRWDAERWREVDLVLVDRSWDATWARMDRLITEADARLGLQSAK